jgi:hypothetical protein
MPDGRSLGWRLGLGFLGLILAGYGAALVYWPQLLGWTVASGFGLLGLLLVLSAVFARPRS